MYADVFREKFGGEASLYVYYLDRKSFEKAEEVLEISAPGNEGCKFEDAYRGYNTYYGGNGVSTQSPVFEYMYNGTLYQEQTTQNISYKHLTQNMRNGETYSIYVNPKHPAVFILSKKIKVGSIITTILGIMFFIAGITMLCAIFPVFWSIIK